MTVRLDVGFSLTAGTEENPRMLHKGVAFDFTVDASDTTDVSSSTFAKGNLENELTVDQYRPNNSAFSIVFELDSGAQAIDCVCVGGIDIATQGTTLFIAFWDGAAWVEFDQVTPTTDAPIMFLFGEQTRQRWRIRGTGTGTPSIYNIKIGKALVFPHKFYAGWTPARMNRQTDIIGNLSRNGGLLGRSKKRTLLLEQYPFNRIPYAWARANLDGPNGVIQSLEDNAAYIAPRPTSHSGDVSYIMRATGVAQPTGIIDLYQYPVEAEIFAYE